VAGAGYPAENQRTLWDEPARDAELHQAGRCGDAPRAADGAVLGVSTLEMAAA